MAGIELVREVGKVARRNRNPRHLFQIEHRPFQIQPFVIAPVLPGETMKSLLTQARVVTDPIKNGLIGWWYEQYFFYVKHRDLAARALVTEMHLNPAADLSSLNTAADVATYHPATGVNWTKLCLDCVVNEYFRDDDEEAQSHVLDNMPLCKINHTGIFDSLKAEDAVPSGGNEHELPGENPSIDTTGPDGVPAGFENHYIQWEHMRAAKLTDATFEDYLKSFGVAPPREEKLEEIHRPELLRYVRDWTYPSNTVNPADGVPASACSWAPSERADKDRYFAEPGFIIGVAVARPKVYLGKQKGAGVSTMVDAYSWLPAILQDTPYTSLKRYLAAAGPLGGNIADDYWIDLRDLLVHGDQFINFAMTETDNNLVALPRQALTTDTLVKEFVGSADVDALFKNAAPLNKVRADGVVQFTIASRITDTTP